MDDPIIRDEDLEPEELEDDAVVAAPIDPEDDHESLEELAEEEDEEDLDMDEEEGDAF